MTTEANDAHLAENGDRRIYDCCIQGCGVTLDTDGFERRRVANLTGRSLTAAYEAIDRFVLAGILTQITSGRRNRAWEATEIIHAFGDFERVLASPS